MNNLSNNKTLHVRKSNNNDTSLETVTYLCELINDVYADAESGMWQPNITRTCASTVKELLRTGNLLLAELDDHIVGCVQINTIDDNIAEFGMLIADQNFRGLGIGSTLVSAAESWAKKLGHSIMQLQLLAPQNLRNPSKEFLKSWYKRIGYQEIRKIDFDKNKLADLAIACDFTIYQKIL